MNIQELRLGNAIYVKIWDDFSSPFTVTEIGNDVLWVSNSGGNVRVKAGMVAGIPISRDTVKNLKGFQYVEEMGTFKYSVDDLGMSIETDDNLVYIDVALSDEESNEVLPNITQIHQLQNLIYDLNGGVMLEYNTNVQ